MESIFENVYTDTEEMFREQYNRSGWVMRAVWVAVFLCLIVYYGIVLLTEQSLFLFVDRFNLPGLSGIYASCTVDPGEKAHEK